MSTPLPTRTAIVANLTATWAALERVAAELTNEQWQSQSLCPAWTAQGVMVHATAIECGLVGWRPGDESPFPAIGQFHHELSGMTPAELLVRFRSTVADRTAELDEMDDAAFAAPSFTPVRGRPIPTLPFVQPVQFVAETVAGTPTSPADRTSCRSGDYAPAQRS